ncbi:hypothetical protein, partial [Anaeromusa sp.]|uniref:hypothetical protein n=1 Tax=Anaeromusa sp. TaxID=1872520 RepID=UPI002B1E9BF2
MKIRKLCSSYENTIFFGIFLLFCVYSLEIKVINQEKEKHRATGPQRATTLALSPCCPLVPQLLC